MKTIVSFAIELDCTDLADVAKEARSIRDTYFIPDAFSGLQITVEGLDNEGNVLYELTEDDQFNQY